MSNEEHHNHSKTGHGHHHGFKGIEKWISVLDNPEREKKQRPNEVIAKLGIQNDDVVADIGAGTGYFAVRIATAYPRVKVIAADTEPEMIEYLQSQSKERKLTNLEPVLFDPVRPQLPFKASLSLIVDTLHHINDRINYLNSLKESMTSDSRIAVIDYKKEAPEGPPIDFRLSAVELIDNLKSIGYELESDVKLLTNQYFLIFKSHTN